MWKNIASASLLILTALLRAQEAEKPDPAKPETPAAGAREASAPAQARTQLNLLGETDTKSGESRRNENIQFNLIDNNAQKELNQRLGVTATPTTEFSPRANYFGSEYGGAPSALIVQPAAIRTSWHGEARWTHLNSILSARAFFQVGSVLPARENTYGVLASGRIWRGASLTLDAGQTKIRGNVNGNILVPLPEERTPLAMDPAERAFIQRILDAYPNRAPNRADIDRRMLNTNSQQRIDNDRTLGRLDQRIGSRNQIVASHSLLIQRVTAFQLLRGQNPDTTTRSHRSVLTWNRAWNAAWTGSFATGFERLRSRIMPANDSLGAQIFVSSALSSINPNNSVPINRTQNLFRQSALIRRGGQKHEVTFGGEILRRQFNGSESDAHVGAFTFSDSIVDGRRIGAIEALRLGLVQNYFLGIGELHRGYRNLDGWFYLGDRWRATQRLTVTMSVGYRPATQPREVNRLDPIPYRSDLNNLAPALGWALRVPRGVFRVGGGIHYGEVFPVTFQQLRFNAPRNVKRVIQTPSLLRPLEGVNPTLARSVLYAYAPDLVSPYSMQLSAQWEIEARRDTRIQIGYVGSRAVKLLHHWYGNRAHPRAGVPLTLATVDDRRARPDLSEIRTVTNGSRAQFDAFKTGLLLQGRRRLQLDVSYWWSKNLDYGSDYLNTANDQDSFRYRSQNEFEVHKDLRGRSRFDQPHSFLARAQFAVPGIPARWGRWSLSSVALAKNGTPFDVLTGSDAPNFGNIDGMSGDRPHLADPAILGRAISHPDRSRALLPRDAFRFLTPGDPSGNLGRNVFRRGPIRNVNASAQASWMLKGDFGIALSAEAINLTNTPQFAEPGARLTDANFGAITNTLNDGRSFRLSLRLSR